MDGHKQMNTTQPISLIAAIRWAAEEEGVTISEWVGDCCYAFLPEGLQETVEERRPAHRQKQKGSEK